MSTVGSSRDRIDFDIRHSLGFVAHPKRLNGKGIWSEPSPFLTYHCDTVAITRARSLLIIIGDPKVLSLDQVWNEFLHYVRKMGGWRVWISSCLNLMAMMIPLDQLRPTYMRTCPATTTSFRFVRATSDGHAAHLLSALVFRCPYANISEHLSQSIL